MRRDYFTCVFLGLIAGALTFVCFKPLYFTWNQIIPRDFTLFERLMSVLYTLFFLFFLPFFAAFKKKEWINWGLAAYGLLAYFPLWFYPAPELIVGDGASMGHILGALCLRAIYAVVQAPFAALSPLIGNNAASSVVYWLLPVAIVWPVVFRILRFYRRAYLSEQLNPMTPDQAAPAPSKAPEAPEKPEVLGTVISAPVTAQTPADITRKNQPVEKPGEHQAVVGLHVLDGQLAVLRERRAADRACAGGVELQPRERGCRALAYERSARGDGERPGHVSKEGIRILHMRGNRVAVGVGAGDTPPVKRPLVRGRAQRHFVRRVQDLPVNAVCASVQGA